VKIHLSERKLLMRIMAGSRLTATGLLILRRHGPTPKSMAGSDRTPSRQR
jgi:hypothetical protein